MQGWAADLDGGAIVLVLRVLIPGVVGVGLNRRIDDLRDARSQQEGGHCHGADRLSPQQHIMGHNGHSNIQHEEEMVPRAKQMLTKERLPSLCSEDAGSG